VHVAGLLLYEEHGDARLPDLLDPVEDLPTMRGARPSVGSSTISTVGGWMSRGARASICCSPPGRWLVDGRRSSITDLGCAGSALPRERAVTSSAWGERRGQRSAMGRSDPAFELLPTLARRVVTTVAVLALVGGLIAVALLGLRYVDPGTSSGQAKLLVQAADDMVANLPAGARRLESSSSAFDADRTFTFRGAPKKVWSEAVGAYGQRAAAMTIPCDATSFQLPAKATPGSGGGFDRSLELRCSRVPGETVIEILVHRPD
jgi:hypothetical protein